jgi:hypothetical protein
MPVSESYSVPFGVDCASPEGGSYLTLPASVKGWQLVFNHPLEAATALKVLEYMDELPREAF